MVFFLLLKVQSQGLIVIINGCGHSLCQSQTSTYHREDFIMKEATVVVIGHTGKTGARVQQRLQAMGINTRGVSRSSAIPFDWEKRETWEPALKGASSVYAAYQPDLAVPGAEQAIKAFVEIASTAGVEHIVLLSGRGEEGAQRAERILQASGLNWNIVRASWFAQNFSEGFMIDGILNGNLVLPAGAVKEPFIDVDDIADVAVAALTNGRLKNRLFEVSGPESITFAQCADIISKALGRSIQYTQVPIDTFIETLAEMGEPEPLQWLMRELFTNVFDGRNENTATGVEEALGRQPVSFQQYVTKTVASGVWKIKG